MTIDKAIEIKVKWKRNGWVVNEKELAEAEALSLEALYRLQEQRKVWVCRQTRLLPGETEDFPFTLDKSRAHL